MSTATTEQARFGPRQGIRPKGGHVTESLQTQRSDFWQKGPLLTLLGFGAFVVYVHFRAFMGTEYYAGQPICIPRARSGDRHPH